MAAKGGEGGSGTCCMPAGRHKKSGNKLPVAYPSSTKLWVIRVLCPTELLKARSVFFFLVYAFHCLSVAFPPSVFSQYHGHYHGSSTLPRPEDWGSIRL